MPSGREESRALVGEVSLVNDDTTDNRFYEEIARFSHVEEDEAPFRVLVSDYILKLIGPSSESPIRESRHDGVSRST